MISDDHFGKYHATNFQIIGVWNACRVCFENGSVQSSLCMWYLEIVFSVKNQYLNLILQNELIWQVRFQILALRRFWHAGKTTYISIRKFQQAIRMSINLPLVAPIPSSTMQNKAKEIVMIPFVEASSNTPDNTGRHKVKCNAQQNFSNWTDRQMQINGA